MAKLLYYIQTILSGLFIIAIIGKIILLFSFPNSSIQAFLLTLAIRVFIPFIIVSIIYYSVFNINFKKWANILKRRDASQKEAEEVFNTIKRFPKVPNYPAQWGYCKQIYYGVLHSRKVKYETKLKIFNKFDELDVHGIRAPRR